MECLGLGVFRPFVGGMSLVLTGICCVDATAVYDESVVSTVAEDKGKRLSFISMMARSKAKARKSVLPPMKVQVKKGAIVHEGSSSHQEQRKPSGFAVYVKDFTRGLKKAFKEDNIIKQAEVMAAMSEWWHKGYWRKKYDETYEGASSPHGNEEEEVNDDESSQEEGDNCPPRPKNKKKSKGESKKKKKVPLIIKTRCSPRKFVSLIGTLTEDQCAAIKAFNPFHTLLDVKCGHMHKAFAMHLVQCFNPETCSIEFKRGFVVHIIEEDVARVLGMPIGETPVPTECLESHREKIEEDFKGGFKGVEILKLENVIKEGHTDGKFHRAYMLFTLGCLLCPTTKEVAGNRLFPGVVADDLQTLKTFKWPAFVLEWLANEIRNYKLRATKGCRRKAEGVGGSLFLLMVIYFDLHPLDVEIGKEPQAPIGLWTKELIDIRISKEEEDKPIEDSVFSQFPPHTLKNQLCIDMYENFMRQFMNNYTKLHEMDAAMGEPVIGSPVLGSPEDGPWAQPVQDEGHSPQFSGNFELHQYEEEEGEEADQGDQIQEKGEEGDQIKEKGDEIAEEGEVGGTSKIIDGSASCKRKEEAMAISTDPTKRKRRRYVKPSPSIKSPYVAEPSVKTTKITEEEDSIINYLTTGPPTNDLSEVLIRIEGTKWPLTRKEVGESFRPRGLVSNMVMYTFTEWRMLKERAIATKGHPSRHIFSPTFASNLLHAQSDEFSSVLRDDCDPDKVGYDVLKCDMLFLPVLQSEHWYCVCVSLVESRVYILDSMNRKSQNLDQMEQVDILQKNLFALLKKTSRRTRNDSRKFKVEYADVPQQANIHDCGIYVMKFVDRWDGRTYPSAELQQGHIPSIRKRLLLHLFMDENNSLWIELYCLLFWLLSPAAPTVLLLNGSVADNVCCKVPFADADLFKLMLPTTVVLSGTC
ncbi:hypothetical protein RHSIM_Rhsim05G0131400 [Rhododendron simsii]|uniref:Ubiquitin-like protease family profile domain-containing protein n=1 Tax=Rhododendron simsii TaxID=118357 RepID=A0A834H2F9_RHOSS|nr:hypothetical protein RHSIM_Rhsim05G0131400 [Rhododendron simsii]